MIIIIMPTDITTFKDIYTGIFI